jgi:hypothetical protein
MSYIRKEFEEMIRAIWGNTYSFMKYNGGHYCDDVLAGMWWMFQKNERDKQAVSVPEWTDINLIQPEEYQVVLWFCQGGNIRTGMYYGKNHCDRVPETHPISRRGRSHYGKFGRYADPAESGHVVTHWLPLPQPPKQSNITSILQ